MSPRHIHLMLMKRKKLPSNMVFQEIVHPSKTAQKFEKHVKVTGGMARFPREIEFLTTHLNTSRRVYAGIEMFCLITFLSPTR